MHQINILSNCFTCFTLIYKAVCQVKMTDQLPSMQVSNGLVNNSQSVITKLSVRFNPLFMSAPSAASQMIAVTGKYLGR